MNSARTLGDAALRVVVDTNAVLDLWAFGDARVAGLRAALEAQSLDWVGTAAMRQELETVLQRGVAARYGAQLEAVLAHWDRHARLWEAPMEAPTDHRLRCRDGDDQKFLDLALASKAQWLLTSDRDLLSLARRARLVGLEICSPHGWPAVGLLGVHQGEIHPVQHIVPTA
ncbi:MAG: putative toxin-antitoxin system toxin component, PIN family [Limnohabitans sp.]|nr:putative toxin-antitoxin system toxin component, PIN family [Limnohabitans sp.]